MLHFDALTARPVPLWDGPAQAALFRCPLIRIRKILVFIVKRYKTVQQFT